MQIDPISRSASMYPRWILRSADSTRTALALDKLLSKGVHPPSWSPRCPRTVPGLIGRSGSGSLRS